MRSMPGGAFMISLIFLLLAISSGVAQQKSFIEPLSGADLSAAQNERLAALRNLSTTRDVRLVRINPDVLVTSKRIVVPLGPNSSVSIRNASREIRNGRIVSWSGQAPDLTQGSTTIIVNG